MNISSIKFILFSLTLSLTFFFLLNTHRTSAQVGAGSIDPINITVSPNNPGPKKDVSIEVRSFNTDLNRANITWIKDGVVVEKGVGITSLSTISPELGKTTTINISIVTIEGGTLNRQVILRPQDIDLIWETDGTVPKFYRGKAPFSYQNTLKITAVPHILDSNGRRVDPKTLIYQWKEGSVSLQKQSGYGKQRVEIKGGIVPRPTTIYVNVSNLDGSLNASGQLTFEATKPEVLLYEESPVYGTLYNKAIINNYVINSEELRILASPIGFTEGFPLRYIWSINGIENPDLERESNVTIRTTEGQTGQSSIGVEVRNDIDILQRAINNISVRINNTGKDEALQNIFDTN